MTRLYALSLLLLTAAPAAAQSDAHRAAAHGLMAVTEVREMFEVGLRLGLESTAGPEMESLVPVMEAFFERYVSWEAVEPQYVDLYVETFSQDELEQLTAFYRTPLGQRLLEEQAHLAAEGSRIGRELVESHQAELMVMIMEAMRADGGPPPPPPPPATSHKSHK